MLIAISTMCFVDEVPLLQGRDFQFITVLLSMLDVDSVCSPLLRTSISRALWSVCCKATQDQTPFLVAGIRTVFKIFANLISLPLQESDSFVAYIIWAIGALAFLSPSYPCSLQKQVEIELIGKAIDEPGILQSLVKLINEHSKSLLQKRAAHALGCIASSADDSLISRIACEQGALAGLVKLLDQHESPSLQEEAAEALKWLAASEDDSLKSKIACEQGALAGLVQLLDKHESPSLQKEAAKDLSSLASSMKNILKWRVSIQEGELLGTVKFCDELAEAWSQG
jgi:hypothetical protein